MRYFLEVPLVLITALNPLTLGFRLLFLEDPQHMSELPSSGLWCCLGFNPEHESGHSRTPSLILKPLQRCIGCRLWIMVILKINCHRCLASQALYSRFSSRTFMCLVLIQPSLEFDLSETPHCSLITVLPHRDDI